MVKPDDILCHHSPLDQLKISTTILVNNYNRDPTNKRVAVSTWTRNTATQSLYESPSTRNTEYLLVHDIPPAETISQKTSPFQSAKILPVIFFCFLIVVGVVLNDTATTVVTSNRSTSTITTASNSNSPRSSGTIAKTLSKYMLMNGIGTMFYFVRSFLETYCFTHLYYYMITITLYNGFFFHALPLNYNTIHV